MKTLKTLMIIGVISLGLFAFSSLDQEEWKVPAKYEKMTNPEEASKENISLPRTCCGVNIPIC